MILRLPQHRSVLLVVQRSGGSQEWLDHVGATLAGALAVGLGGTAATAARWVDAAAAGVLVVHDGSVDVPSPLPPRLTWGRPIGPIGGDLADDAVARALANPADLRDTRGRFVLCEAAGAAVRLVSSADTVHTLRAAAGPVARVWGTHSVPVAWLAGLPIRLHEPSLGALLLFDHGFGDHDLVAGVRLLDEAAVVAVGREGGSASSWWPVAERLEPGPATTPAQLRQLVREATVQWAAVDGVVLGLTAGRDSTLVASCLQETGLRLPAFTLGPPGYGDVAGAARTAGRVGLEHRHVVSGPPVGRETTLGRALLTGGAETARNLTDGAWDWIADDSLWLTGHGGEIGRAFHWHGREGGTARGDLLSWVANALPPAHAEHTASGFEDELAAAAALGRSGEDALDVFYVRNRMRRWLGNVVPRPQVADSSSIFLAPRLVQALLDLPVAARIDGSGFDAALNLGPENLRPAPPPPPARLGRIRRFRQLRRDPGTAAGNRQVDLLLARFSEPTRVGELVGGDWWRSVVARARVPGALEARRVLFNALAVEALLLAADALPSLPRDQVSTS